MIGRRSGRSPASICRTTHRSPGLWNVGDAVKEYANGGTTACAETAQLVVDKIVAAHRPARLSGCGPHSTARCPGR